MMHLYFYDFVEIISGAFFFWVGVYLTSRNPLSKLSWIVFALLVSLGLTLAVNPIYANSTNLNDYVKWQKIIDLPLFLIPIFYYHASVITTKNFKFSKWITRIGYIIGIALVIMHFKGLLVINEQVRRTTDPRFNYPFSAGILLLPSVIFEGTILIFAISNYFQKVALGMKQFWGPMIGGILYVLAAMTLGISYYSQINYASFYINSLIIIGTIFITYSTIKYCLYSSSEKNIFDKFFLYNTITIFIIGCLYLWAIKLAGVAISYPVFIYLQILFFLVLFTHSFYNWFTTFINDLMYNPSSGFSVVNDEEVYHAIKNYKNPSNLEHNSLLRLKSINKKDTLLIDGLRDLISSSIKYFEPKENSNKRTKSNLKYHLLKMIAFDEAEEGQILWELGFEEYPVRIMANSSRQRPPLFETKSPSDYFYTSRNAYLALKKEAIHDVTWRISYLEKQSKRKIF